MRNIYLKWHDSPLKTYPNWSTGIHWRLGPNTTVRIKGLKVQGCGLHSFNPLLFLFWISNTWMKNSVTCDIWNLWKQKAFRRFRIVGFQHHFVGHFHFQNHIRIGGGTARTQWSSRLKFQLKIGVTKTCPKKNTCKGCTFALLDLEIKNGHGITFKWIFSTFLHWTSPLKMGSNSVESCEVSSLLGMPLKKVGLLRAWPKLQFVQIFHQLFFLQVLHGMKESFFKYWPCNKKRF